jgi:DNA-binding transcriptional LysR family regulator
MESSCVINRGGDMEVFVQVVELGSFSAASRKLRLTPSGVSKLITRLEDRLGVPLVVRSTRSLTLTSEGQEFFNRASRIVAEIDQAEIAVTTGAREVRGVLRVNSNIPFATRYLLPIVPKFLSLYSSIQLELTTSDIAIDLIGERTDVAIRTGVLTDSAMKARKLLESRRMVVLSPEYAEQHGVPAHPSELSKHNCLAFSLRKHLDEWPFRDASVSPEIERLAISGNMRCDNGETMRTMALAGVGIARLSEFHVGDDVRSGRLRCVLDDFNPGDVEPIHAIYVSHDHLSNRIRAFIDFVSANIRAGV